MSLTNLFVNINASSLAAGLCRSLTDLTPIPFPELVIGDGRYYNLFFVDGQGNYASWSGDASYTPNLAIGECGYPSGGTFTLKFGANTTAPIAWNASMATIQTAFTALASVGGGNAVVAGVPGQYFTITFQGALAAAAQSLVVVDFSLLTPASNCNVFTLVAGLASPATNAVQLLNFAINPVSFANNWTPITNGWTGQLSTSTLAALQAFAALGTGQLSETFQITVADPSAMFTTYVKTAALIYCTIINPTAYAGSNQPTLATQAALAAAVLGLNNFTQETIASSAAGNSNVTRGSTSRHHIARVTVTGAAGTRTFSLLTSSSPVAGDTILLSYATPATAGIVLEVHNATSGGTLLSTVTTTVDQEPFYQVFEYSGTAWVLIFDSSIYLAKAGNLAGIASPVAARTNLKELFSTFSVKSANFTVGTSEDGFFYFCQAPCTQITLPNPATVGDGMLVGVMKGDTTLAPITFVGAYPPSTTYDLSQYQNVVILRSNSANWIPVLAYNPGLNLAPIIGSIANKYAITGLTGGGSTKLDGIGTDPASNNFVPTLVALCYGSPPTLQLWQLVAGTDAAVTGRIVRPSDYNGITNPQVWKLVTLLGNAAQSPSAQVAFGYLAGAGNAVAQVTNRTTGVTCNFPTGQITTNNTSLAALAAATFTVTNSLVGADDTPVVSIASGQTNVKTDARVTRVAAGAFDITIHNIDASTAETGSIVLNFNLIKGSHN